MGISARLPHVWNAWHPHDSHELAGAVIFWFCQLLVLIFTQMESYGGSPLLPLHHGSYYFCFLRAGSGFTFTFLIYLELVFTQGGKHGLILSFCMWMSRFPSTMCWRCFLLSSLPFLLLSNTKRMKLHVLMPGSLISLHWSICLFLCQRHDVLVSMILQ